VRPAHVESKRSEPHVTLAATFAAPAGMFNGFFMMEFDEHYVGCGFSYMSYLQWWLMELVLKMNLKS
jgi:hypothetical protein